ncbi:MAG: GNAT family N-acetyltransferase [Bacteroidota bacterium]
MTDHKEHLEIIKADVSHIPLIIALNEQVWPQTYIPIIGEQQVAYMMGLFYTPEALKKQMTELQHQFIICYYQGTPAAFASYSAIEPGIYKLHKIYILPSMQGKGIGRYVLGYITDDIAAQGATTLRLNVNIHNHAAKAFYEKTGFRHFKDEDIDIGGGYFMNDHVLSMPLE